MKTTVEIPDELFRQAKAKAALEGVRLRDLVEHGIRLALDAPVVQTPGRRAAFPLIRSRAPATLHAETVAAVLAEMEEAEMENTEVADDASVVRR